MKKVSKEDNRPVMHPFSIKKIDIKNI